MNLKIKLNNNKIIILTKNINLRMNQQINTINIPKELKKFRNYNKNFKISIKKTKVFIKSL